MLHVKTYCCLKWVN